MSHSEVPSVVEEASQISPILPAPKQHWVPAWLRKSVVAVAALALFILALELLKKGAGPLGPVLKNTLGIENATNTLGFGWLVAYCVLSGSPVAAISLSFFDQGVITDV